MSAISDLVRKARNSQAPMPERLVAVRELVQSEPARAIPALVALSSDASLPSELTTRAGRELGLQLVNAGREDEHDLFRDLTGEAYLACDAAIAEAHSHGSAAVAGG